MFWIVKSESDIEKVWAEVGRTAKETGKYRYEFKDGRDPLEVAQKPGEAKRKRHMPSWLPAVAIVVVAEAARLIFG
jgi:hypothetical protein